MATVFQYDSTGATDELDVDAVTGRPDTWTSLQKTTGFTIKHDTAHLLKGLPSVRYTRAASTDNGYSRKALGAAVGRLVARAYVWIDALPAAGWSVMVFRHASGFMGQVTIGLPGQAAGRIGLLNGPGSGINASVAPADFPLSQWVRVEAAVKKGTTTSDGTIEFAYYLGDSTTAVHSYSTAIANTGTADPIEVRFGLNGATTTPSSAWLHGMAMADNASGWIGPLPNTPPTGSITANQNVTAGAAVTASVSATDPDGSIASYAWSVVAASSSSTPTLSGASTATVSFTAPAAGNLVTLQCVVTDNSAATTTFTTEVRVPTSSTFTTLGITGTGAAWTNTGGASNDGAALADSSDTTYSESPEYAVSESERRWRLQPLNSRSTLSLTFRNLVTATGGTVKVRLYEGSTQRQEWTITPSTSAVDTALTVSTPGAISDWGALWIAASVVI